MKKVVRYAVSGILVATSIVASFHLGYRDGRRDEMKASLPFDLSIYLQMHRLRSYIDTPERYSKDQLMKLSGIRLFIASALSIYEQNQEEFDQGRWATSVGIVRKGDRFVQNNIDGRWAFQEQKEQFLKKIALARSICQDPQQASCQGATNEVPQDASWNIGNGGNSEHGADSFEISSD